MIEKLAEGEARPYKVNGKINELVEWANTLDREWASKINKIVDYIDEKEPQAKEGAGTDDSNAK